MTNSINSTASETELRTFALRQWEMASRFLRSHFNISTDDSREIFRQAFISLYLHIRSGRLRAISSSLPAYFIRLCRDKALRLLRRPADHPEMPIDPVAGQIDPDRVNDILALEPEADDPEMENRRDFLVRWMVKDLSSPSDVVLRAAFRDNLSIPSLAAISDNTDATARLAIRRYCDKFTRDYANYSSRLL